MSCHDPESLVLSGLFTLTEANAIRPGSTEADVLSQIPERRVAFNAAVSRRFPGITDPVADRQGLEAELATMRPEVRAAFETGEHTLIQARFAERARIIGEKFERFRKVNEEIDQRRAKRAAREGQVARLCEEFGVAAEEVRKRLKRLGSVERVRLTFQHDDDLRLAATQTPSPPRGDIQQRCFERLVNNLACLQINQRPSRPRH